MIVEFDNSETGRTKNGCKTVVLKKLKIRMADVAREAGVSVATVDRVIHGRPGVKENTVSHIMSVIENLESGGRLDHAPYSNTSTQVTLKHLYFDILLPDGLNLFYRNLEKEILECANRPIYTNTTIRIHRFKSFDPTALANTIKTVSESTDGIAVVAIDNPRVQDAVNRAAQSGIPVITLVSDLSTSQRTAYIGVDNRACGRTAGYLMGRFLGDTKGSVLMLAGSHSLHDHEQREIGFLRVLREQFPKITVIPFLEDKDDDDTAYEQVQKAIKENDDLIGVYDIGAGTRGIAKALQENSKDADIVFIGHELTQCSRELLTDGVMDAVIDQVPRKQAHLLLEMLESSFTDENDRDNAYITATVYFRENLP